MANLIKNLVRNTKFAKCVIEALPNMTEHAIGKIIGDWLHCDNDNLNKNQIEKNV